MFDTKFYFKIQVWNTWRNVRIQVESPRFSAFKTFSHTISEQARLWPGTRNLSSSPAPSDVTKSFGLANSWTRTPECKFYSIISSETNPRKLLFSQVFHWSCTVKVTSAIKKSKFSNLLERSKSENHTRRYKNLGTLRVRIKKKSSGMNRSTYSIIPPREVYIYIILISEKQLILVA